jgi:uncharacterized protein (TIGR02266 family)
MPEPSAETSRRHPRYEVEIWVDFSTIDLVTSSYVLNLSEGGVFIKSDRPLPLDAEVDLILTLPTGIPVKAVGRVVWNHDLAKEAPHGSRGAGVRFVDMPDSDRALLRDYVASLGVAGGRSSGH